ncbi:MAG TPA: recombinase family protein [Acidimicrobiales bacterium]|nr:recombinase family protein [Acidimicrobiales bacterium]
MNSREIGYARVSTDEQDLTAQRNGLAALGVAPERIYVDQGLTGTNRERPGLRQPSPRVGRGTPWRSPSSTG